MSESLRKLALQNQLMCSDTTRNTVPVPNSDNDDSQEDSDSLFDDELLPSEKNKLMRLRKEIKRIKDGQTYPTGYERDRAREIKSADAQRLSGEPFPAYLEGVDPPWIGMGKAQRHYDDNEISKRETQIERIKFVVPVVLSAACCCATENELIFCSSNLILSLNGALLIIGALITGALMPGPLEVSPMRPLF